MSDIWWWLEPMFETGVFTTVLFWLLAILIDKASPYNNCSFVLSLIGLIPLVIAILGSVAWFVVNTLIFIWRCRP